ncbi:MAG: hypothetical protein HZA46_19905 [Planctomycetales bacterium]|nr:hypothetical protein [Planctomycetales bacterium]
MTICARSSHRTTRCWVCIVLAVLLWIALGGGGVMRCGTADDAPVDAGKSTNEVRSFGDLQLGDRVPSFYVRAVTGPHANKSVCYVCRYLDRPVAMIVVRSFSPGLTELLRGIDTVVDESRSVGLRSFVVFVAPTNPPDADSRTLSARVQTLGFDEKLSIPLTVAAAFDDAATRPGSRPADVTVVLYRRQQVVTTVGMRRDDLTKPKIRDLLERLRRLPDEP